MHWGGIRKQVFGSINGLDQIAARFDGWKGQAVYHLAPCTRGANGGYLVPSPALSFC